MKKLNCLQRVKKADAIVLGAVLLLKLLYFLFCNTVSVALDSGEFIGIDGFAWLTGNIDRYRLPVYPMVIELCERLFGGRSQMAVCMLQLVVSLASTVAMYSMMKKLSDRAYVYLPVFVLYGLSTVVMGWDKVILTESLSISLTVFVLWGLVSYIKEPKLRYIVFAVVCAGIGAFLRAVFAVYAGAILVFLLLRLIFPGKKEAQEKPAQRKLDAKGLIVAVIPVLMLLGYAGMFSARYGAFTLSDSGLGQRLYIVLEQGYYQDAGDGQIKADADHILSAVTAQEYESSVNSVFTKLYGNDLPEEEKNALMEQVRASVPQPILLEEKYETVLDKLFKRLYGPENQVHYHEKLYRARCYIMESYDRARIERFVDEAMSANFTAYLKSTPEKYMGVFSANYQGGKNGTLASLVRTIPVLLLPLPRLGMLQALLISVAELAVYFVLLLRKKQSQWLHLGFGALILATCLLALFGTNGEFARTAITVYPMLFGVFAIWIDRAMARIWHREAGDRPVTE